MSEKKLDRTPVRAASYCRTSAGREGGDHLTAQKRACRERAGRDGLRIPPEFEFHDRATAGTARNRAGLEAMRKAAAAGRITVLYVADISRLTRDASVAAALLTELADVHGVLVLVAGDA